ncbi:MAG: hypothetical protein E7378_03435 [Clostridiales bacterium]|nr:hypothetical protein [Clostridiales bacterium]
MYCKNCGNFIGTDDDLCEKCSKNTAGLSTNKTELDLRANQINPEVFVNKDKAVKLWYAITAMVCTFVGSTLFIFSKFSYIINNFSGVVLDVLTYLSLASAIGGIVFGILAIINFRQTSRSKKRIPLLILGIIALVECGLLIIFSQPINWIVEMIKNIRF